MIDRNKENGHVPYTKDELNDLLSSGLRQMRVAAIGVLPNGRVLSVRAVERLSWSGMRDAEKALRQSSRERIKLDKGLSIEAFALGVGCTLYNIDFRHLERNPELARVI